MNTAESIEIEVQLFAGAAQLAGRRRVRLDVPRGVGLVELNAALLDECPELAPLLPLSRWARGTEFIEAEGFVAAESMSLAMIPPVSGG